MFVLLGVSVPASLPSRPTLIHGIAGTTMSLIFTHLADWPISLSPTQHVISITSDARSQMVIACLSLSLLSTHRHVFPIKANERRRD